MSPDEIKDLRRSLQAKIRRRAARIEELQTEKRDLEHRLLFLPKEILTESCPCEHFAGMRK